ncbi:hypothetical protein ACRS7F_04940 [Brucella anthropi]|uniref:hypothetical protein n=1 Tax=Brucella anthropi TaxID=529 RepID=UPI003EE40A2A
MKNEDQRLDGSYTLRLARNLIFLSYKEAGITEFKIEFFEKSPVVKELGATPSGWNEGLFRYLDECINLLNASEYCFLTPQAIDKNKGYSSIIVLIHQMKSNCAAVRLLGAYGLDSQARLSLRALYENGIGLCRALVDKEFRLNFFRVKSSSDSNEFWHKYISKSKSEKFLVSYNGQNAVKCPLVVGDTFKDIYQRLGVSAHPNYIFSHFEYLDSVTKEENLDRLFNGSEAATEFVLTSACHIVLSVIFFMSQTNPEISLKTPWIMKKSIFGKFEYVDDVLKCVGKISGILMLMLMKWSNRQKADFDPLVHL